MKDKLYPDMVPPEYKNEAAMIFPEEKENIHNEESKENRRKEDGLNGGVDNWPNLSKVNVPEIDKNSVPVNNNNNDVNLRSLRAKSKQEVAKSQRCSNPQSLDSLPQISRPLVEGEDGLGCGTSSLSSS